MEFDALEMSGCEECANERVPGALWPMASDGDGSRPYVERHDLCDTFANDEEAAQAVATAVNGIVVHALRHDERGRWQPAVYPNPDPPSAG